MKKIIILLILTCAVINGQSMNSASMEELKIQFLQDMEIQDSKEVQYKDQKKNTGLAILYSALLPGMGELYAGDYSSGKYFTIADGVLWGGLIGVNAYAKNQEDN